ncbi:hypothetical protein [Arthrobacter koreensis]|uniref:hypothetical protein n=1 Tax=Arthrobacter koreensis TaxID=199136 RepID=UPI0011463D7E|nr:hypothetical protein [Arthrobacter koreensis]
MLAFEREGVVSYISQFLDSATTTFVGRSNDSSIPAYCDRTNNFIALSARYIGFLVVYAASVPYFAKLDHVAREKSSFSSTLSAARQDFDRLLAHYFDGTLKEILDSPFLKEATGEFVAGNLMLASTSESWMIAHEYGHLISKRRSTKLRTATDPLMRSLVDLPPLQNEYARWNEKWREELSCDFLACQYLLRGADPALSSPDSYAHLMSALQSPLVALTCADTLGGPTGGQGDDSHPPTLLRIVILVFVIIRRYGEPLLHNGILGRTPGAGADEINIHYFCATLLEYATWILGDQESLVRRFPGVEDSMSLSVATEYRYKRTYELLVELSLGEIADDYLKDCEYWLSVGYVDPTTGGPSDSLTAAG